MGESLEIGADCKSPLLPQCLTSVVPGRADDERSSLGLGLDASLERYIIGAA